MASLNANGCREVARIIGSRVNDDAHDGPVRYFLEYALRSDGKILQRMTHVEYLNGYPGAYKPYNALKSNPNKIPHSGTWSHWRALKPGRTPDRAIMERLAVQLRLEDGYTIR